MEDKEVLSKDRMNINNRGLVIFHNRNRDSKIRIKTSKKKLTEFKQYS